MSVVKFLEKEYGGKWKYAPSQKAWNNNDGKRYVVRCKKDWNKLELHIDPKYMEFNNQSNNE